MGLQVYGPTGDNVGEVPLIVSSVTGSAASNFVEDANTDDGSCVYYIYGCMDKQALNFDSSATVSAACVSRVEGCMDSAAANFAQEVQVQEIRMFYAFQQGMETIHTHMYTQSWRPLLRPAAAARGAVIKRA